MSRNDPLILVRDMLDHAKEAVEMASKGTSEQVMVQVMPVEAKAEISEESLTVLAIK